MNINDVETLVGAEYRRGIVAGLAMAIRTLKNFSGELFSDGKDQLAISARDNAKKIEIIYEEYKSKFDNEWQEIGDKAYNNLIENISDKDM